MTRRYFAVALSWVACSLALLSQQVSAQEASPQQVRIVLPFAAGNSLDAAARALADSLHQVTKRTYIIDNKPGAGAMIGSADVARAKPDGSVLLYTTGGHTTNAALYKKLPFDPIKDFTPITQISESAGFLLLVSASSPYKTAQDFIADAKKRPGAVSYGSAGTGNTTHLVGALFARSAGVSLLHVPYKGTAITDLLGGHIDSTFLSASLAKELLSEGKVRALAVSGNERVGSLPDVPTFNDLGFKGVDIPAWSGILAPPGMSATLARQIQREVAEAVRQPGYISKTKILEQKAVVSTPSDFAAYLSSEIARLKMELAPLGIELN
jgi:tripartite-type tricarboxylate transporter receptor subunit TctC